MSIRQESLPNASDIFEEESTIAKTCYETSSSSKSEELFSGLNCADCKEYFEDETTLKAHEEKHQLGLICPGCRYEGNTKSCMISHSRSHLDRETIKCLICKERLPEEGRFDLHIADHAQKLTSCPWCPYVNAGASDLKKHIDHHLKTFVVHCNMCKYYAFSESELKSHSELHFREDEMYKKRFNKYQKREKSQKRTSEKAQPGTLDLKALLERAVFRCGLCGVRSQNEEAYESHLVEHIRPGLAYCPHCPHRTDDKEEIITHVLGHLAM